MQQMLDMRAILLVHDCRSTSRRVRETVLILDMVAAGNLADATALAVPFGTFDGRLPRAIQLLGPPGSERVLLDLADRIIAARDRDESLSQPEVELV